MEDEIRGENPSLGGEMRTMVEFEAAIHCIHGHTIAPHCAICHKPNWLDCPVRPDDKGMKPDAEGKKQTVRERTVRDVVKEFFEAGKILPPVEVIEFYFEGKRRRGKKRKYKRWGFVAGLAVTSGILIYHGGKLALRLWVARNQKKKEKGG